MPARGGGDAGGGGSAVVALASVNVGGAGGSGCDGSCARSASGASKRFLSQALPACSMRQRQVPSTHEPRALQSARVVHVTSPRPRGEPQSSAASGQSSVLAYEASEAKPSVEGKVMVVREGHTSGMVPADHNYFRQTVA
jgi:hypothetical protein